MVNLMSLVVCEILPSVKATYQAKAKGIGVTVQAVYQKLNRLEVQLIKVLLRHGVSLIVQKTHSSRTAPRDRNGHELKLFTSNPRLSCPVLATSTLMTAPYW